MSAEVIARLADAHCSAAGWWRINCPFCEQARPGHGPDRGFNMSVSATTGWYKCWRCPTTGRIEDKTILNAEDRTRRLQRLKAEVTAKVWTPPEGFIPLWGDGAQSRLATQAIAYMAGRGVSPRALAESGTGFVPLIQGGKWAGRVIVPLWWKGVWAGWVGRDFTARNARRYLYPPGMARYLWNAGALEETGTADPLIVVEGVFDALPHWPNAVACLGKPTSDQLHYLTRSRRDVVVALDRDAYDLGWGLVQQLRLSGLYAVALRMPPNVKDPGELERDQLLDLSYRELAQPAF